jgi:enoyl-CoA hydratase/carnithine racemase
VSDFVKVDHRAAICEIRLARPDKRNAITDAMYAALADALEAADADPDVAVAILHAEGRTFTGGNDLKDFIAVATAGHAHRLLSVGRFLAGLTHFTKPLIAAVQGQAVGVGTTLLLHCDLVIAEADAQFLTPFVDLGLTPEGAASLLMPARMGYVRAYALLALGQILSADAALAAGLVNEVVPTGTAFQRARAVAATLALRPPQALAITKALMRGDQQAVCDVMSVEGDAFYAQAKSPEAQAAFMAFFQKTRSPETVRQ